MELLKSALMVSLHRHSIILQDGVKGRLYECGVIGYYNTYIIILYSVNMIDSK